MTKTETNPTPPKEEKVCMIFLRNVKTADYEIFKWKRQKLTQTEIDLMHEQIKVVYPKQSQWIMKTPMTKDCGCK